MRLFAGLPVPPLPALDAAARELEALAPSARLAPPGKRHVTLRFLGEGVDPRAAEAVLRAGLAGSPAVQGRLAGMGGFPETRHARVAWAGVAAPGLDALAARVRAATAGLGQPETHPFSPHVTLARLPRPHNLTGWCARHAGRDWGPFAAAAVVLYASRLGEGAYRELAAFPLGPAASVSPLQRPVNRESPSVKAEVRPRSRDRGRTPAGRSIVMDPLGGLTLRRRGRRAGPGHHFWAARPPTDTLSALSGASWGSLRHIHAVRRSGGDMQLCSINREPVAVKDMVDGVRNHGHLALVQATAYVVPAQEDDMVQSP